VAGILGLVTDGANACTSEGSSPPALDALLAILCQPLEGCLPNLALTIGIGSGRCCRGNTRAGRVGGLGFLVVNLDESIMKRGIGDDGVDGRCLNIFGTRPKLIDNCDVAAVKRAKEEHHQQHWRDNHLATLELESEAIKMGPMFKERIGVTLNIVEDGKK
jgi:hypothetical protein